MKALLVKIFVISYTLFVAVGATALLLFSVKVDHYAENSQPENQKTQLTKNTYWDSKIPSGPFYEKVEYNEPFAVKEFFSPVIKSNITVTHTSYDSKKLGQIPIIVTFTNEKEDKTTRLLILDIIDTTAPIIETSDLTLYQGEVLDIKDGVTATDSVDGDLSKDIEVSGDVDTRTIGTYTLTYQVKDKSQNLGEKSRIITVIENPISVDYSEAIADDNLSSPINAEPLPVEEYVPEEAAPMNTSLEIPVKIPVVEPTAPAYQPNSLYLAGIQIPYSNGGMAEGQSVIDSNPNGAASTWGGAAVQSGSDGLNTHFIGHNPGVFSVLFSLGSGSPIIVTDGAGQPTTYIVNGSIQVDDQAIDSAGNNYWDTVTGVGGGERITLQTCVTPSINLIIFASA